MQLIRQPLRFSITFKLLSWCLVLIAIFYVATQLLLHRVKEVETLSNTIVGVNYKIVENSEIMANQLISLLETKKRYEILGKPEHKQLYQTNLQEYEKHLKELLRLSPDIPEPWQGLYTSLQEHLARAAAVSEVGRAVEAPGKQGVRGEVFRLQPREAKQRETQPPDTQPRDVQPRDTQPRLPDRPQTDQPVGGIQGGVAPVPAVGISTNVASAGVSNTSDAVAEPRAIFLPDAVVNDWLAQLGEARQANRRKMQESLVSLYETARTAERAGNLGLVTSLGIGLAGSVLIAFSISRALRELRRGIRRLSSDGRHEPVRVLSNDELGEVAVAFNRMTEQLKREEQMRSDFISMLSHEIRTPLTSIREAVNMIKQGILGEVNDRQKRFLDISGKEVNRLSNLLTRLMQVSSMESRDLVLDMEPVDAARLTSTTVERMFPTAEAKKIDIRVDAETDGAVVWADAEHIRQVLLNLMGNAVKFSPEGSVVTVRVEGDRDRERMIFTVQDQGPGIPEDEQPFVFRKYYRAEGIRESVDGAGLGLSISKRIVEAHGGAMWLHSSPGQGSAFCFSLPTAPG